MSPHSDGHINRITSQPIVALSPQYCVLSRGANTYEFYIFSFVLIGGRIHDLPHLRRFDFQAHFNNNNGYDKSKVAHHGIQQRSCISCSCCTCVWQFCIVLNGLNNSRGKSNRLIIFLIYIYLHHLYVFIFSFRV